MCMIPMMIPYFWYGIIPDIIEGSMKSFYNYDFIIDIVGDRLVSYMI
jgi:hypothetical protein